MANLAAYRTRITNSLSDVISKYSTTILDEALRKILNEYTRAFPNIATQEITIAASGRTQTAEDSANLMSIIQLVHPYDSALSDPFIYGREDFITTWQAGKPYLYFTGNRIPQAGEKIYVKFSSKQTIEDLDAAAATTVRDDHEDLLVTGAAGQAAMMRASGLNETWGAPPGESNSLMLWGSQMYREFQYFLTEIRTEQTINIFPETYWPLDKWDK